MPKRKNLANRDPSREPFASPYPEGERIALDIPTALAEIQRATRKSEAARQQIEGGRNLFVDPKASDMSTTATILTHLSMVESLAQMGKKFDHPRPRGALDDLGGVMLTICKVCPTISYREMLTALADLGKDHPVVQEVEDETIHFRSKGKEKRVGKRGLQDRMTRIRKLL